MPGKIFINYRRDDAIATAGRLHDRLSQAFGRKNLFMDVDHIPPGVDFVGFLSHQMAVSDLVLVVIGPDWLDARNEKGNRRLDDPGDFVSVEIAAALSHDTLIIPVLVDGARMPDAHRLLESVKPLVRRNAVEIRNTQFGSDAERLIEKVREALRRRTAPRRRWMVASAVAMAMLLGVMLFYTVGISVPWLTQPMPIDEPPNPRIDSNPTQRWTKEGAERQGPAKPHAEETKRQRLAEASRQRAEASRADEDAARQRAEAEEGARAVTEARRNAEEAERQRLAALEAEASRQRAQEARANEDGARQRAETEARAKAVAEARRNAEEAERQRLAALEAEQSRKREEAKRRADEDAARQRAEAEARAKAGADARRKAEEADRQRLAALEAEKGRQRAEASIAQLRGNFRDCPDICPEMVIVPAGTFLMGADAGEDSERPAHQVMIATPFAVGKFEVTFAEWDACTANGGCGHKPDDAGWGRGRRPVINVSYDDITNQYLPWLTQKTGKQYRLLSEAEWEYSARAGTTTDFFWGNEIGRNKANCNGCADEQGKRRTLPVGSFQANGFGLHDMQGNVWEVTSDCWNTNYQRAPLDGSVWTIGDCKRRVIRGGSWYTSPKYLTSSHRDGDPIRYKNSNVGFRVARGL